MSPEEIQQDNELVTMFTIIAAAFIIAFLLIQLAAFIGGRYGQMH